LQACSAKTTVLSFYMSTLETRELRTVRTDYGVEYVGPDWHEESCD